MKPRSTPPNDFAEPALDLPAAPGFISHPPRASLDRVLEISAAFLPRILSRPAYWEDRIRDACAVEFDLQNPDSSPPTYPKALIEELLR